MIGQYIAVGDAGKGVANVFGVGHDLGGWVAPVLVGGGIAVPTWNRCHAESRAASGLLLEAVRCLANPLEELGVLFQSIRQIYKLRS